uniref:Uncharacterized protein n=1 Tax=Plectus sambesii TaxID=2011161 RepID=A0A914UUQ9_9BILA
MVAHDGKTGSKHWYRQTIEEKRWLWRSVGNLHDLDKDFKSEKSVPAMDRLEYLTMPDYGLSNKDIKYFHINSVVTGRGPNRLRYLDLEGRWNLNGNSIPYISAAFNHWERMNLAQDAFRDIKREPLNAIGMVGWTPSKIEPRPVPPPAKKAKKPFVVVKPPEPIEEPPPSPRELVPHRSAGYGPAHQRRKLSVPSRSPSVSPRGGSPVPEFDRYAVKYERKDSAVTPYGTKWGSQRDLGYSSAEEPMAIVTDLDRPPHRTQLISPAASPAQTRKMYDTQYDPSYLNRDREQRSTSDDLKYGKDNNTSGYGPYRNAGYGQPHIRRQFDITSPQSTSSSSDHPSPDKNQKGRGRNADNILVSSYHSSKTTTVEYPPRRRELNHWIRDD